MICIKSEVGIYYQIREYLSSYGTMVRIVGMCRYT
jgi:hypothetical protein